MSQTIKEQVTVEKLGPYGPKVGDVYYGWSKNLKEKEKGTVISGGTYDLEVFVADSGKKYINKVLGQLAGVTQLPVLVAPVFTNTPVAKEAKATHVAKPSTSEAMTKAEWSAKDRSQLIGGLSHDAAAIVAAMVAVRSDLADNEKALAVYKDLLEGMLEIRDVLK